MAAPHFTSFPPSKFPQPTEGQYQGHLIHGLITLADNSLRDSVVRAIVHLNFNEPDQARDVLLRALSDSNFVQGEK